MVGHETPKGRKKMIGSFVEITMNKSVDLLILVWNIFSNLSISFIAHIHGNETNINLKLEATDERYRI